MRAEHARARAAVRRLSGVPRAELGAVLRTVDTLAGTRRLTPGRLEPVFLVLRRNRAYWTRHDAPPAGGARFVFGRDPAVFQYYAGQGLQLQQLASWGRLNAQLALCLRKPACPFARLRRELTRMVSLGARRDGFLAWESYFSFGGGTPPWISGMTQGTAVQALARAAIVFEDRAWQRVAERALGAFQAPPPSGVSLRVPGGRHYLMYSFSPGLRILNGDLQAITGLRDLADLGGSRTARVLFDRGERAARRAVGRFDTGAWSLYSERGREAPLNYHQLVGEFLDNLCRRTNQPAYCGARDRFARYEVEPPRIRVAPLRGLHAKRATTVRFALSKLSEVTVRVTGARGFATTRRMSLARGTHAFSWTPPARGSYRVRIAAKGPSGPVGRSAGDVRVVLPRPKKPKRRAGRRAQPLSTPGTAPLRKASTKRR
jgi:D-glucuronyl C5-epimerase C-terminus